MEKKKILFSVLIFGGVILSFTIGLVFGIREKEKTFQLGFEAGVKQGKEITESEYQEKIRQKFPQIPPPKEIYSVAGEIVEIKGNELILREIKLSQNPFEEEKPKEWRVIIGEETEIKKQTQKTKSEIIQEDTIKELIGNPRFCFFFLMKEMNAQISDLKVGNLVTVFSNENLLGKETFEAKKILILFKP